MITNLHLDRRVYTHADSRALINPRHRVLVLHLDSLCCRSAVGRNSNMVASSFKTRLTDLIKECFELTTEKQLRIVDDILQLLDNEASVKPQFILGAG